MEGGTSIYSTGSSPGFVTEALPIPLLSLSRRLDCLTIDEFGDLSAAIRRSCCSISCALAGRCGPFDQRRAEHLKADFAASLAQLAAASGIAIDRWEAEGEYSPARETVQIAAGTIAQGTIGAQRITISGIAAGTVRLRFRANWYATSAIAARIGNLRESGWRMRVEGRHADSMSRLPSPLRPKTTPPSLRA